MSAKKPKNNLLNDLKKLEGYVAAAIAGDELPAKLTAEVTDFVTARAGYKSEDNHWLHALAQVKNSNFEAAKRSFQKVMRAVAVRAADFPFQPGDEVYLTRSEGGWHNGNLRGKVLSRSGDSYEVLLLDEGYSVHVNHTRDMTAAY